MVMAHRHDDTTSDTIHLRRHARCYGLAEVFAEFGSRYTAKQLYRYYRASRILVHKRIHGKSSPVRQAAAHQRHNTTGRYGFHQYYGFAYAYG